MKATHIVKMNLIPTVGQELDGDQRVVGIAEQGVDSRNATEAAVVPFCHDDVLGAQDAAADTVQLVAVEHQLAGVERKFPEDD